MKRLRRLLGMIGGLWAAALSLVSAASLSLTIAMAFSSTVFTAVSGLADALGGGKTVLSRFRSRETELEAKLASEKVAHDAEIKALTARFREQEAELTTKLSAERAARDAEVKALNRELEPLRLRADGKVLYRGEKRLLSEAVKDTSDRVVRRAERASLRNVASTFGEAIPVYGIAVIVASTAWELHDACAMMKEMRELDAAFNPDNPISDPEVCGIRPPTTEQIWTSIKSSPGAVWEKTRGLYDTLPEVSFSGTYTWLLDRLSDVVGWFWSSDSAPPDQTQETP